MWAKLNQVTEVEVDFKMLEEQFAVLVREAGGQGAGGAAKASAPAAKKAVMLLNMQRNQNVGVLLANLKMSPAQVWEWMCQGVGMGVSGCGGVDDTSCFKPP